MAYGNYFFIQVEDFCKNFAPYAKIAICGYQCHQALRQLEQDMLLMTKHEVV